MKTPVNGPVEINMTVKIFGGFESIIEAQEQCVNSNLLLGAMNISTNPQDKGIIIDYEHAEDLYTIGLFAGIIRTHTLFEKIQRG